MRDFFTIDHSCQTFFWYLPNWTFADLWCVVLYISTMVKNLSCVSCAAWNVFPINSLMAVSIGLKVFSVLLSLQLLSLFATCRKKTQGFQQHFGPVHCPFIQKLSTKNKIKAGWNLNKGIFVKNLDQILKKNDVNWKWYFVTKIVLTYCEKKLF